jgi:hypothetical protein
MAFDAPSARPLAAYKSASGVTLSQGPLPALRGDDAAAQPCARTRLTATPQPSATARRLAVPPMRTPVATAPLTPARKLPPMRRYEVMSLDAAGQIDSSRHVAPALPVFEAAFSAFAHGTLLATPQGLCAIEDLTPGTEIETVDFGLRRVMWIGAMTILPDAPVEDPAQNRMTRIMADAFGMGRPMADVMAGPGARMLHRPAALRDAGASGRSGQVFVPVADFQDGTGAIRITPPRPVTVYHLCLDRHATLKVAGLEMESYHPGPGLERQLGPNMLSLFLSLFPHITNLEDFGPLARPRATRETLDSLTAA